jgi:hypothetical protein
MEAGGEESCLGVLQLCQCDSGASVLYKNGSTQTSKPLDWEVLAVYASMIYTSLCVMIF